MITYMCVALCTYFYICVSLLLYDMISLSPYHHLPSHLGVEFGLNSCSRLWDI